MENVAAHESTITEAIKFPSSVHESFTREFSNLSNELQNHFHTIQRLLKFSDDIRRMVRTDPDYSRNFLALDNHCVLLL